MSRGGARSDETRVSARDVASRAGVSQPTVSRVLSGGANVRPETRDRVLGAARELGYRPSMVGRLLQGRRAVRIAVVVDAGDRSVGPVLDELAESLDVAGLELEVVHACVSDIDRVAGELSGAGFDRVIVGARTPIRELRCSGLPDGPG